jgi:membrane-associated protease RseP (regulator of RpoE activity)
MFARMTMVPLTLLALAIFGGAHFLVHGIARHFSARGLGVRGTKLVLAIGDRDAFAASPPLRRALAAAMGPAANYLLCALCFFVAHLMAGDQDPTLTVRVIRGYPAAEAGLRDGDRIVSVEGKPVTVSSQVRGAIQARGTGAIALGVDRSGTPLTFSVEARDGRIGVEFLTERRAPGLSDAAADALPRPALAMYGLFTEGLRRLVVGSKATFTGPVGITRAGATEARDQGALLLALLATCGSYAWPASILVAFFANRARRRAG